MEYEYDGISLIPGPTQRLLNGRQTEDYRLYQEELVRWLLNMGKNPDKAEGYSRHTVDTAAYQIDKFHRYIWTGIEDGYTQQITTDHADQFMQHLAVQDWKQSYKASLQKSVKREFNFRFYQRGGDEWEPQFNFYDQTGTHQPRDYLSKEERGKIREAALEYGSVPSYANLSGGERNKWRAYLAQRFDKPKSEVTREDWKRANSWKYPSLVWASLDTGLRPIEVERAVVSWVDLGNEVLRIPKAESSKNQDNWVVALSSRTARALEKWLDEREQYEKYENTEKIWLTREGNPYGTNSLAYTVRQLCDIAGISYENREMTWYTIRHSVGTQMSAEEGLGATQAQMRHKDERTTMRYDQAPVENRREALDRMG